MATVVPLVLAADGSSRQMRPGETLPAMAFPGTTGRGIVSLSINSAGHLLALMTDGSTLDAGVIPTSGSTGGSSSSAPIDTSSGLTTDSTTVTTADGSAPASGSSAPPDTSSTTTTTDSSTITTAG